MTATTSATFVFTGSSVTVFLNGEVHTVSRGHINFEILMKALRAGDWATVPSLLRPAEAVTSFATNGKDGEGFTHEDGLIFLDGEPFCRSVSTMALRMMKEAADPEPLRRFLRRVRRNPSRTAQEELLLFHAANDFMIDEEGFIIAFRGVNHNLRDLHTNTFDNSPGQTVRMPRHQVDDRRDNTCSYGLHFGSLNYAKGFGARTVVVRVDPENVVSIPSDYNNEKGRCCEFTVLAEITGNEHTFASRTVYSREDLGLEPEVEEEVYDNHLDTSYLAPDDEEEEGEDWEEEQYEEEEEGEDDQNERERLSDLYDAFSRDQLRSEAKARGLRGAFRTKQSLVDAIVDQELGY
jgi:hypothetical protein